MRATAYKSITTDSTYDAWSPSRAYSHYHGGVRILQETASARLATPITIKFDQLQSREGYDPQKESANFGPLWRGGEWHIGDITRTMTTVAFFLLKNAAQNREHWLQRFYEIEKEAVRSKKPEELFAYVILPLKTNMNHWALGSILSQGGVEVFSVGAFTVGGKRYSTDTIVVPVRQPYASFAKALLEARQYPDLRNSAGQPIPPYDVTAHALPLLMGVEVEKVFVPFRFREKLPDPSLDIKIIPPPDIGIYRSHVPSMDEGWSRFVLERQDSTDFVSLDDKGIQQLSQKKYGPSLKTIIIPDQSRAAILNGHRKGTMPEEYTGGLGAEGVKALREFVEQGGTLVCLNRASDFAIEQFKLPLRDVVDGLPRTDFYVPGSILRIELDTSDPIAKGMPKESIAWVENSPVFEITERSAGILPASLRSRLDEQFALRAQAGRDARALDTGQVQPKVIAWYPKDKDPLLSGWLLG